MVPLRPRVVSLLLCLKGCGVSAVAAALYSHQNPVLAWSLCPAVDYLVQAGPASLLLKDAAAVKAFRKFDDDKDTVGEHSSSSKCAFAVSMMPLCSDQVPSPQGNCKQSALGHARASHFMSACEGKMPVNHRLFDQRIPEGNRGKRISSSPLDVDLADESCNHGCCTAIGVFLGGEEGRGTAPHPLNPADSRLTLMAAAQ